MFVFLEAEAEVGDVFVFLLALDLLVYSEKPVIHSLFDVCMCCEDVLENGK